MICLWIGICTTINGSSSTTIQDKIINFAPPYRRIDVTEELTRLLGPLPDLNQGKQLID